MTVRSLKSTSVKNTQKAASSVVSSTTAPSNPSSGDLWFNTELGRTFLWYIDVDGGQWVEVGAGAAPSPLDNLGDLADVSASTPQSGDTLVYSGSEWVNQPLPGRNLLHNGAMQVHQRRTSITGLTGLTGYYTADRWQFNSFNNATNIGTWTQTIENDAPTGSGLRKSFKMLCTTAKTTLEADSTLVIRQEIEGQNLQKFKKGTSEAREFATSFWVKSNVTGTYVARLVDRTNNRHVSAQYTITTSDVWEKKTIIFPKDLTGTIANTNSSGAFLGFMLVAGSNSTGGTLQTDWGSPVTANLHVGQTNLAAETNNYWQITGVQLEVGEIPTPFEFKPFGQELAECQRYYFKVFPENSSRLLGSGFNSATTSATLQTTFPVTMRTTPTALEQSGTATDYAVLHSGSTTTVCSAVPTFSSLTTTEIGVANFTVASGLTAGQGSIGTSQTNTAYLAWSAEL